MSVAESNPAFTLDTKISSLVPSFNTSAKRDITIRQAFSHSSGLTAQDTVGALSNANITLQESADLIVTLPMVNSPPGSKFAYSGVSMQAGGAAAEVAVGTPFATLMSQRIFSPLGMSSSRFVLASQSNPRVGGGVESTAIDFGIFMDTLRNGGVHNETRILQPSSVQAMFTRQTAPTITLVNSPLDGPTAFARTDYGVGTWILRRGGAGGPVDPVEAILAAGARGFHSYIDLPLGLTAVFATDRSSSGNTVPLSIRMNQQLKAIFAQPRLAGDFDLNNTVDFTDLVILARHFNTVGKLWVEGDTTGDGLVDFSDLVLVARNFNRSQGKGSSFEESWRLALACVPEPTTLAMGSAVAVILLKRWRASW